MTPERAKEIYYSAITESYRKHDLDWSKPRIQLECEMDAWRLVVDEIRKETETELLKEMMEKGAFNCRSLSDPPTL